MDGIEVFFGVFVWFVWWYVEGCLVWFFSNLFSSVVEMSVGFECLGIWCDWFVGIIMFGQLIIDVLL